MFFNYPISHLYRLENIVVQCETQKIHFEEQR